MRLIEARPPRPVHHFDLITPAGRTYRYPQPRWFDRLAAWMCSIAEPAILSAVVLGITYSVGVLAGAMEPLTSDPCRS
jgi:hypothetical protein